MNNYQFRQVKSETIERLLSTSGLHDIVVRGEGLYSLQGILELTGRLAPMVDDEERSLWVEIPDRKRKIHWYRIRTCKVYNEYIGLLITDGRWSAVTFRNDTGRYGTIDADEWEEMVIGNLLTDIENLVSQILKDPDKYNRHVEECLPKQMRMGRIPRRSLEEIVPDFSLDIADPDLTRKALIAVRDGKTPTLKSMTIREFCHWYRVAFQAFHKRGQDTSSADDVEYYGTHCFCNPNAITNMGYDPDSEKDFIMFATDHYGEIGLTRCDVRGMRVANGRKISIDASYYIFTEELLDMIGALYAAGAPLYVHDPDRLLAVIDKTDWFAIKPNTYHDYRSYDDTDCGGSLTLPLDDEVPDDGVDADESRWNKARLEAVIAAAEWQPIPQVKPFMAGNPGHDKDV